MFVEIKPILILGIWKYRYKDVIYATDSLAQRAVLKERKHLQKRSPNNVIRR